MLAESARIDVLAAMGIEVWQLRAKRVATPQAEGSSATRGAPDPGSAAAGSAAPQLVLVCAANVRRATQHRRFFDGLARTLGIPIAALGWLEAGVDGSLAAPENAPTYIILGDALTRHFGAHLSAQRQSEVTIAVCAEPGGAMRDATSKRMFWQSLKPVARRLRLVMG